MMTTNFQLQDVVELIEVDSYEKANDYLKTGWVLISTHLYDYGHPVERHQKTVYCLGRLKSAADIKHPEGKPLARG